MELSETILNSNGLTESMRVRLSHTVRKFFCFCEEKGRPIEQVTDKVFLDFVSEAAKSTPGNMTIVMRALKIIADYIRSNGIVDLQLNLSLFRPQTASRQMISGYSQEEISKILSVINEETSRTPKRDRAMILLVIPEYSIMEFVFSLVKEIFLHLKISVTVQIGTVLKT